MKRILLHVGTHKTGSTSLQESFDAGRDVLEQNGITYLGTKIAYPNLYSAFLDDPLSYPKNKATGKSAGELRVRDMDVLSELRSQLADAPCDTVVISSEHLCMLPRPGLRKLKAFLEPFGDVQAIYFYRELLPWMSSDSQQLAKGGWRAQPTTFATAIERVHRFPLRVQEVFGPDTTTFIKFEDAVRQGICNSFLSAFGLPTMEDMGLPEIRANESISGHAVRALYAFNFLFPHGCPDRPMELLEQLRALDGPKYTIEGLKPGQIAEYARKRDEVQTKLGFVLQDPSEIAVADTPDPLSHAIRDVLVAYQDRIASRD